MRAKSILLKLFTERVVKIMRMQAKPRLAYRVVPVHGSQCEQDIGGWRESIK